MRRALDIQAASSSLVVAAFVTSEGAARFLAAHPASPVAWRLNMGLFRPFETLRTGSQAMGFLFGPASLPVGCALLLAIAAARVVRSRFLVALCANLSFIAALCLLHAAGGRAPIPRLAALLCDARHADGGLLLAAALAAGSFAGFAASHWSFARVIVASRRPAPGTRASLGFGEPDLPALGLAA